MNQTPVTHTSRAHALLIGVNDYKSFNGTPEFDLKGSRNDVLLLASYCVEVLGMQPENIVALTTPKLTQAELGPNEHLRRMHLGEALEKEVTARLASLLRASKKGTALLAFSGHGAALPDGEPVLCLGDTTKDFTSGVLSLKTLGEGIKKASAKDRLIALFDCCHVGSPPAAHSRLHRKSLPHTAAAKDVQRHDHLFQVSDRVLLAAGPAKEAYQMRPGMYWYGMFTFALVTAARQWRGKNEVSHGSYKHVLRRTKRTMKALGVPQRPKLRALEPRWLAIRKEPFLAVKAGPTQRAPDALKVGMQLDPNYYTIEVNGTPMAHIVATGNTAVIVSWNGQDHTLSAPFNEYWFVNAQALAKLATEKEVALTIKAQPMPSSPFKLDLHVDQMFRSPEGIQWSSDVRAPTTGTSYIFRGKPALPKDARDVFLLLNLALSSSGEYSIREVQWYLTGLAAAPSSTTGALQPGGSPETPNPYSYVEQLPTGYWASASL